MIRISPHDTQWAIAGKVATTTLEQLARTLPKELQGEGSKVVAGQDGFSALLVFGDLPNERLARQLLATVTPVYLLDFDDDAPVTLKLDRNKGRVTETNLDKHPADLLEEQGIVAPGYENPRSPVLIVGLVDGTTPAEAKYALEADGLALDPRIELRSHPRGVLIVGDEFGVSPAVVAMKLKRRTYVVFRNPEDGWFSCVVHDQGRRSVFSVGPPDANATPLDDILGETTPEGILGVLEIPGKLLGLSTKVEA